ncbi:MAG: transposase [Deltaproteobacteria bacterium]|nr:transposase [Deltaproteobacteria bacterium]
MDNKIKQRGKLRLTDFDYKGNEFVYFITICTADKQPYFLNDKIATIIADEIEFRRIKKEIKVFCYCIMPDHLHILLSLTEDYRKRLQDWVSAFKRYTAKIASELFGIKPLWQKNFYDHIVRKEESLLTIAEYIVNNPVRKGMVPNWEEYLYSKIVDPLP